MKQLIVAKFNENVSWIKKLNIPCVIYDKSDSSSENHLVNVGYEANTYLHHIVNKWDELAELSIFTQGNPFPHCVSFIEEVEKLDEGISFKPLYHNVFTCNISGEPNHPGLNIKEFWDLVFSFDPPRRFKFPTGAIFAINKKVIQIREKKIYEKLLDKVVKKNDACVMERLWCYIFNVGLLKNFM